LLLLALIGDALALASPTLAAGCAFGAPAFAFDVCDLICTCALAASVCVFSVCASYFDCCNSDL
jgi:hypothetical protein